MKSGICLLILLAGALTAPAQQKRQHHQRSGGDQHDASSPEDHSDKLRSARDEMAG